MESLDSKSTFHNNGMFFMETRIVKFWNTKFLLFTSLFFRCVFPAMQVLFY